MKTRDDEEEGRGRSNRGSEKAGDRKTEAEAERENGSMEE